MSGRRREALLTAGVGLAAVAIQLPIFDRWLALLDAAILCKQDYGAGVGGALGLFFVARPFVGSGSFAPAALYAAGGALVVLPAFAAVVTAGLLGPLVEQTFVRPLALVSSFGYA